jgi:hypothetical protein
MTELDFTTSGVLLNRKISKLRGLFVLSKEDDFGDRFSKFQKYVILINK